MPLHNTLMRGKHTAYVQVKAIGSAARVARLVGMLLTSYNAPARAWQVVVFVALLTSNDGPEWRSSASASSPACTPDSVHTAHPPVGSRREGLILCFVRFLKSRIQTRRALCLSQSRPAIAWLLLDAMSASCGAVIGKRPCFNSGLGRGFGTAAELLRHGGVRLTVAEGYTHSPAI